MCIPRPVIIWVCPVATGGALWTLRERWSPPCPPWVLSSRPYSLPPPPRSPQSSRRARCRSNCINSAIYMIFKIDVWTVQWYIFYKILWSGMEGVPCRPAGEENGKEWKNSGKSLGGRGFSLTWRCCGCWWWMTSPLRRSCRPPSSASPPPAASGSEPASPNIQI